MFNNLVKKPLYLRPLSPELPAEITQIWQTITPYHRTYAIFLIYSNDYAETNYLPAISEVRNLVKQQPKLHPYIVFLTDGIPGDKKDLILDALKSLKSEHDKLDFTAIGFCGAKDRQAEANKFLQQMCGKYCLLLVSLLLASLPLAYLPRGSLLAHPPPLSCI